MKYIVTGGAGFIGSALCMHLAQSTENRVLIIDCLTYAAAPQTVDALKAFKNIELRTTDLRDGEAASKIVDEFQPDVIFHLAAETHVDRSIDSAQPFIETNLVGTFNILEAARRYMPSASDAFRFVHVSTDEVFGALGETGQFDEDTKYDPSSPYSASKAGSDHLVRAWHRTYGLPVLISNCSNNYGPRQFPEKLIPLTILNCLDGNPLPVYGKGLQIRDWLYVEDHARALQLIAEKGFPGETYAVGGRCEKKNIDVVRAICDVMDELKPKNAPHSELIEFVDDRPGHDFRYSIDSSKVEASVGWKPDVMFETGLRKTVEWYLDNPVWWKVLRDEVYSGQRLGRTQPVQGAV